MTSAKHLESDFELIKRRIQSDADTLSLLRVKLLDQKARDDLRRSLKFYDIDARQQQIAEAHRKTFNWIFDPDENAIRPWDNFVSWLLSESEVYWVSGKAGSGKTGSDVYDSLRLT